MPLLLKGAAARKSFNKPDLRRLRRFLTGHTDPEEEITETDPQDRPVWNPTQRVFSTTLTEDTQIHGLTLGAGSEIFYTENGRLTSILLGKETQIGVSAFRSGSIVYFYKEGSVDWVSLADDTEVTTNQQRGLKLKAQRIASFYPNGTLKETTLAEETSINGYRLSRDSLLHFSNTGRLVWAHIKKITHFPFDSQRLVAQDNSCVEFHHNGQVRSLLLAKPITIQGHHFDRGVNVHFDMAGKLSLVKMKAPADSSRRHAANMAVRFRRDGEISEITVT